MNNNESIVTSSVAAPQARGGFEIAAWALAFITGAVLMLSFAATTVSAQTLRGVVQDDSTKRPLDGATVVILSTKGVDIGKPPVRTDSLGRFTIHAGDIGKYQVKVTRIGYQPLVSQSINFSFGGMVHNVTLNMTSVPTRLGKVVVTGTTRLTNMELMSAVGFDLRKSKGNGKFLDSAGLGEYGRLPVAAVLENNKILYGLEFVTAANGFETIRMIRGSAFCAPEIWIDGFEANPASVVGRLNGIGSDELYGAEFYNGLQLPPPSLGGEIGGLNTSLRPSQRCGAMAIWTKAYAAEMKAKAEKAKKPPPKSE